MFSHLIKPACVYCLYNPDCIMAREDGCVYNEYRKQILTTISYTHARTTTKQFLLEPITIHLMDRLLRYCVMG